MKWPVVPISDVAKIVGGSTPKSEVADYWNGEIPWVTPKDISDLKGAKLLTSAPRSITPKGLASCSAEVLPADSVIFSSRAPIGLVAINTFPVATNQGFKSFVPDRAKLDSGYLLHWLRFNRTKLEQMGVGATFKELSKAAVARIKIPLPPLEEQKRIAALLDKAEEVIAKRRAALALLDQLPQSLFLEMFGDPAANPFNFVRAKLHEFCDLQNGYAFSSSDYVDCSSTLNCRMSNIRPDGTFDPNYNPKYLPDAFAQKHFNYLLNDGDVIIAMTDMANEARILGVPTVVQTDGKKMLLNQRVGKLKLDSEVVSFAYLKQALSDKRIKQYYMKFASGGVQINLGKSDLLSASILLPPLDLQRSFATRVEVIQRTKHAHQAALVNSEALAFSLQSSLLEVKK